MKRIAVVLCPTAAIAFGSASVRTAGDPALKYQVVKVAASQKEPATAADLDEMMSKLGPIQAEHAWGCANEEGTFLSVKYTGQVRSDARLAMTRPSAT